MFILFCLWVRIYQLYLVYTVLFIHSSLNSANIYWIPNLHVGTMCNSIEHEDILQSSCSSGAHHSIGERRCEANKPSSDDSIPLTFLESCHTLPFVKGATLVQAIDNSSLVFCNSHSNISLPSLVCFKTVLHSVLSKMLIYSFC